MALEIILSFLIGFLFGVFVVKFLFKKIKVRKENKLLKKELRELEKGFKK